MCLATNSKEYPTRQKARVNKANTDFAKRLRGASKEVGEFVSQIPYEKITVNKDRYLFLKDPNQYKSTVDFIQAIIDEWLDLGTGRSFLDTYVGTAYQEGTTQSSSNIASMLGEAANALTKSELENILFSQPYQSRIENVYARQFELMKGFSDDLRKQLSIILANGVAMGENPADVAKTISDQITIGTDGNGIGGFARAFRIARTEINNAYRMARQDATDDARNRLGINVTNLWRSALASTTRYNHAIRHGKTYTTDEVRDFYSKGANAINCYCSQTEVLLDDDGNVIQKKIQDKYTKQREAFLGDKQ